MANREVLYVGDEDSYEFLTSVMQIHDPGVRIDFKNMDSDELDQALEQIRTAKLDLVITGWKTSVNVVYGPAVVAQAVDRSIPSLIYSGHADAQQPIGSVLVDKNKISIDELAKTISNHLASKTSK